jgi:integrase
MSTRKTLSDKGVTALKPRAKRYAFPDPELSGHFVRVTPQGAKSFVAVTRNQTTRKQVWTTIGAADKMSIDEARALARDMLNRVRAGLPAVEPKGETFGAVADNWLKRHAEAKGLRSIDKIKLLLNSHVRPVWDDLEFLSIRRSNVAALLDEVEDDHSARQADAVLTVVRAIMNWFATRHDDYQPPIVRGMRRQSPQAQARARVLEDGELRAIWKAAESAGAFGAVVRLCLLTAQRRAKLFNMKWPELDGSEWSIPRAPREKENAGTLVLPNAALAIIEAQPELASNPYVFAGRSNGPINGISKCKRRLDDASGVSGWRLHDLRRTARSLMSRAGVRPDIAERVMGHAIGGVEGVYDRHTYKVEKADALQRLSGIIDGIVAERGNVVTLTKTRHG